MKTMSMKNPFLFHVINFCLAVGKKHGSPISKMVDPLRLKINQRQWTLFSVVDHGFDLWLGETKYMYYQIGICCFSAKHAA